MISFLILLALYSTSRVFYFNAQDGFLFFFPLLNWDSVRIFGMSWMVWCLILDFLLLMKQIQMK